MNNTYTFNTETKDVLIRHGWYAKRTVDIASYVVAWEREGYAVSREAKRFSRSLGGLGIRHAAYRAANQQDESVFDPVTAIERLDSRWVTACYEALANSRLCPIGYGYSAHMTYLLWERGEIYGGYDAEFWRIGQTVEEAFYNMFFRREFEPLGQR